MKKTEKNRGRWALGLSIVFSGVALGALAATGWAATSSKQTTYPRAQTLLTSGTQLGPIQGFNPFQGNYAVGTVGLCNETLLRYDPLTDKYIPWLAKSAGFSGKTYNIKVRSGIKWSDGDALTGADVAYTLNLGQYAQAFWHTLLAATGGATASGDTVTMTFTGTPNYQQFQNAIWSIPIVQRAQWNPNVNNGAALTTYNPSNPVCTGPYALDSAGYDPATRVVWKKRDVWWAAKLDIAPSPKPAYIIDLVTKTGIEPTLSKVDLYNAKTASPQSVVAGQVQTYFPKPPYHLQAGLAALVPNTTHKPLNDVAFRKALAYAINIAAIIKTDFANQVEKANPTGLATAWQKWINNALVNKYGLRFKPAKAKQILAAAGYKDGNGDGYVENKDGSKISLVLIVPTGQSDFAVAADMIANDARHVGIKVVVATQDPVQWRLNRNMGKFDLLIDDITLMTGSPWTYFDYLFHLPILALPGQTFANFERYANTTAWSLVQKLDRTPLANLTRRKAITDRLEKISLQMFPVIPLWYEPLWAYYVTQYWHNWPSAASGRHYLPTMWRGYLNMTGIDMIDHLQS